MELDRQPSLTPREPERGFAQSAAVALATFRVELVSDSANREQESRQ
jgi:hypothetical protein